MRRPLPQPVRILPPVATMLGIHAAMLGGRPELSLLAIAAGLAVQFALGLGQARGLRRGLPLAGLAALFAACYLAAADAAPLVRTAALPSILVGAALALYFARSLLPGEEPVISRVSRVNRGGGLPAPLVPYTRRLTALWACFFALLAATSAVTAFGDLARWSWLVNVGGPLAASTLFLGEHALRAVRFRSLGHHSPLRTLRVLLRPNTWMPS